MKITKAQGMACLRELETGIVDMRNDEAIEQLGWLHDGETFSGGAKISQEELQTALAMCAAIAGVKPE